MPDAEETVCEVCRKEPATHFVCNGSTGISKHLCAECYGKEAPLAQFGNQDDLEKIIQKGKCDYCGAPAAGGASSGGILSAFMPGHKAVQLWCERCAKDLKEFYEQPEFLKMVDIDVADEVALTEAAPFFQSLEVKKEEFMRERVKDRYRGELGDGFN